MQRPLTGKSEFRNRTKKAAFNPEKADSNENSNSKNNKTFKKAEGIVPNQNENSSSGKNSHQTLQAKLNKTTKFSQKPGISIPVVQNGDRPGNQTKGFGVVQNDQARYSGHNYTVSINFNRPQQSKGQRPNKASTHSKQTNKMKN